MVDERELDRSLREAFDRLAEPGDPAGVADRLRERIAAGDTGTTVEGSVAPGFGATGGLLAGSGALSVLPWIAVVAGAGLLGTVLGFTGVFGRTANEIPTVGYTAVLDASVPAQSCPGGPVVTTLIAGTRVLAVERSDDGAHLGIRNPNDLGTVVWVDTSDVVVDGGGSAAGLPVGPPCPAVRLEVVAPEPTAKPAPPDSRPAPKPPKPQGDKTKPMLGTPHAAPNPIYNLDPVTITVSASDNIGVTGVKITWSNQYSGSAQMTKSGGSWKYTFTPPTMSDGTITFTVQARDAAGNLSSKKSVTVSHIFFG